MQSSQLNDEVRIRLRSTYDMERCVGEYDGCEFTFYHDKLESDEFFSKRVRAGVALQYVPSFGADFKKRRSQEVVSFQP